jgi:hypothetical protein
MKTPSSMKLKLQTALAACIARQSGQGITLLAVESSSPSIPRINRVFAAKLLSLGLLFLFQLPRCTEAGTLDFQPAYFSPGEASGSVTLTVVRSGDSSAAVTVDYATSNLTAKAFWRFPVIAARKPV